MIVTQTMSVTADEIVRDDLDRICGALTEEFASMAGKRLLIVGGAGFLGYYMVQSILHWNSSAASDDVIRLTVYDNYIRGVPDWLAALDGDPNLELVRHDISTTAPRRHSRLPVHRACRLDSVTDLLPPVPDRNDGRQCQRITDAPGLRGAPTVNRDTSRGLPLLLQQ